MAYLPWYCSYRVCVLVVWVRVHVHVDEVALHFNQIENNFSFYFLLGQPATIKVDVKMPENYPVDLYYLMDLSGSMVEDLKKFPTLGQQIGIPFQGALMFF